MVIQRRSLFNSVLKIIEPEMFGESNMETYITICKIDSQWEFAVWLRKLKQGLSVNLGASLVAQRVKRMPAMQVEKSGEPEIKLPTSVGS